MGDELGFLNFQEDAAGRHIPRESVRVFLATGTGCGSKGSPSLVGAKESISRRLLDAPSHPFPAAQRAFSWCIAAPSRSTTGRRVLGTLGVDWLVARNSGGSGSRAKIDAARRLGIPVAMIRRPPQPEAARAQTLSEVLAWIGRRA